MADAFNHKGNVDSAFPAAWLERERAGDFSRQKLLTRECMA